VWPTLSVAVSILSGRPSAASVEKPFSDLAAVHREWDAQGRLLIFGCLAFAPSKKCGRCLLTKFGLAYSTANFRRLVAERCLAFNIFDALPPHTVAAAYSGPINATAHNACH
jgi:hypothetical protein